MNRRKPVAEVDPHAPVIRIFFPHSRKDYGSERALAAERAIKAAWPGCEIIDPRFVNWKQLAREEGDTGSADEAVVKDCNIVVALEHQGHVGRGVYGGLSAALRLGRAAYVYRDGHMLQVVEVLPVDPNDWAVRFGRVEVELPDPDPFNGEFDPAESEIMPDLGDK